MPKKGQKLRRGSLRGGKNQPFKGKRGSGKRFSNCVKKMSGRKGVRDPKALCGSIKRAKYG